MNRRFLASLAPAAVLALAMACARNPDPDTEPDMVPETPVRIAPPVGAVKPGDCPEAMRRALAKPDLEVDRLATPRASVPSAVTGKAMPAAVRRAKYNEVRVTVLIDTLGKANMSTFKVIKSTHPWLASSMKTAVAKWSFEPAQLAGCKVPRVWLGAITSGKAPAQ
ncbi:MAG: hypothetical protein H7247_16195 [Polaromonas sp.]|nr:hypothetical protein [Gemmatimonadaceae bacterium]